MSPTYSLLHATYRAGPAAVRVREIWLERARRPLDVEHVFSMDADDEVSVRATEGYRRSVNPPTDGVTAVRNWNAAAAVASGRVLAVVADDLTPPPGWDDLLAVAIRRADPDAVAWVVQSREEGASSDLIRHPVVSRAYFERFGLFDPAFRGVFCDYDLTLTCFRRAFVFDLPGLVYHHAHPLVGATREPSVSQRAINDEAEYDFGRALMTRKWPTWRRRTIGRYPLPARLPVPRRRLALAAWHGLSTARQTAAGGAKLVSSLAGRDATRPSESPR